MIEPRSRWAKITFETKHYKKLTHFRYLDGFSIFLLWDYLARSFGIFVTPLHGIYIPFLYYHFVCCSVTFCDFQGLSALSFIINPSSAAKHQSKRPLLMPVDHRNCVVRSLLLEQPNQSPETKQKHTHTHTHTPHTHPTHTPHTHTPHTHTHTHTQHTTHNTQHTTHNTQHTTHNTQHTTHNTQHTTHNTQHTTHNTQHTTHTHNTLEKPQRARCKTSVRLIRWCPFHYLLRIG